MFAFVDRVKQMHLCTGPSDDKDLKLYWDYAIARLTHSATVCNDATAQCMLGMAYSGGYGVVKDQESAAAWFLQSGLQGHVRSQLEFAVLVTADDYNGEHHHITKTQELAIVKLAANMGQREAFRVLADMYRKGDGVPQDHQKSKQYLRQAAQLGDTAAKNGLMRGQ